MSVTLNVPKEYGYVLGAATLTTLVATWHTLNTSKYRKAAKIPYPNAYATRDEAEKSKEAYLFNCAQRSHANFLERQPQVLVGMLVGGLRYPVVSACMGVAFCAFRVAYTVGYCRADKENGKGRSFGARTSSLVEIGIIILSCLSGYQLLMN